MMVIFAVFALGMFTGCSLAGVICYYWWWRQFSVQRLRSLADMQDTSCEFSTVDHDAPDMKPTKSQREADANIRVRQNGSYVRATSSGSTDLQTQDSRMSEKAHLRRLWHDVLRLLTVEELKVACRSLGSSPTGLKDRLIDNVADIMMNKDDITVPTDRQLRYILFLSREKTSRKVRVLQWTDIQNRVQLSDCLSRWLQQE